MGDLSGALDGDEDALSEDLSDLEHDAIELIVDDDIIATAEAADTHAAAPEPPPAPEPAPSLHAPRSSDATTAALPAKPSSPTAPKQTSLKQAAPADLAPLQQLMSSDGFADVKELSIDDLDHPSEDLQDVSFDWSFDDAEPEPPPPRVTPSASGSWHKPNTKLPNARRSGTRVAPKLPASFANPRRTARLPTSPALRSPAAITRKALAETIPGASLDTLDLPSSVTSPPSAAYKTIPGQSIDALARSAREPTPADHQPATTSHTRDSMESLAELLWTLMHIAQTTPGQHLLKLLDAERDPFAILVLDRNRIGICVFIDGAMTLDPSPEGDTSTLPAPQHDALEAMRAQPLDAWSWAEGAPWDWSNVTLTDDVAWTLCRRLAATLDRLTLAPRSADAHFQLVEHSLPPGLLTFSPPQLLLALQNLTQDAIDPIVDGFFTKNAPRAQSGLLLRNDPLLPGRLHPVQALNFSTITAAELRALRLTAEFLTSTLRDAGLHTKTYVFQTLITQDHTGFWSLICSERRAALMRFSNKFLGMVHNDAERLLAYA